MGMLLRRHNIPLGKITERENIPLSSVDEQNLPTAEKENEYTKTDINRMSTSELRDFAKSNGVANAEDITGAELKKILIDMFNL